MLVEPDDLTAPDVLRLVQRNWGVKALTTVHLPRGARASHWVCGAARRPRWLATADDVSAPGRQSELEDAYAAARHLAGSGLHFVVATIPAVDGSTGVRHGRHLLTLTAYLEGESGPGEYADDNQRALIARELGTLHAAPRPPGVREWRPDLSAGRQLAELLETVDGAPWDSGPFGESVRIALRDSRTHLVGLLSRFDVLVERALRRQDRWVLTHGEPHTANVLWRLGGPVLVDWESLRVAPRERDLRTLLRDADSAEPLSAYVGMGGTADLDADMVELFDLERWLQETALLAIRFSTHHEGDADEVRSHRSFLDEVRPTAARSRR